MNNPPLLWHVGGEDVHRRIPLLRRLADSGFRVGAVGTQDPKPFDQVGINYYRYDLNRNLSPFSDLKSIRQLTDIFNAGRPDIIHAFDTKPAIYAMMAGRRAGIERRVRTITGLGYMFSDSSIKAAALRHIYGWMHRSIKHDVSCTIFQNPDDEQYYLERGLVEKADTALVLGSGINIAEIDDVIAQGPTPDEVKRSLGIAGRKVALLPSRLIRSKGVMEYVAAARQLYAADSSVLCLLAGPLELEGPQAVLETEIQTGGAAVKYIGNRPDILSVMAAVDVVVLPTYYREGVPRSLLEAGAIGKPVITTDEPGSRETVIHGTTGWLVKARDASSLAAAMSRALSLSDTQKAEIHAAARDNIDRKFELKRVVQSYSEIYSRVRTN